MKTTLKGAQANLNIVQTCAKTYVNMPQRDDTYEVGDNGAELSLACLDLRWFVVTIFLDGLSR